MGFKAFGVLNQKVMLNDGPELLCYFNFYAVLCFICSQLYLSPALFYSLCSVHTAQAWTCVRLSAVGSMWVMHSFPLN